MTNLTGPRKPRSNDDARRGVPMTADEVRWFIDNMERKTKDKAARISVAQNAIKFGNITPDGKDVYREYLKQVAA